MKRFRVKCKSGTLLYANSVWREDAHFLTLRITDHPYSKHHPCVIQVLQSNVDFVQIFSPEQEAEIINNETKELIK